ncbi:MAG: FecR domain-containing protein [Reichenbachiella sp.]|uniref:FecR family protein n=1 Tax=Reichenbachiella sp. TaxID=2184521 RepID=UPI0032677607
MKHAFNHIEDFLADEKFKRWVINPTPESTHYWTNWINKNENCSANFVKAQQIIKGFKFQTPDVNSEKEQRILNNILENGTSSKTRVISLWNYAGRLGRVAAMILLTLTLGLYFYNIRNQNGEIIERVIITKSNPSGTKSKIRLPDGTMVSLNALSSISYTEGFNDSIRAVKLEGEAYFEVAKNPNHPFVVKVNELSVRALGTAFDIDGFDSQKVKVYLTEGEVKVTLVTDMLDNVVFLNPGEMTISDLGAGQLSKGTFQIEDALAWTNNALVFKKASFDEVIKTLSRWYDIKFEVINKDRIGDWSYSSSFKNNPGIEHVLKVISETQKFSYKINGKRVTLTF